MRNESWFADSANPIPDRPDQGSASTASSGRDYVPGNLPSHFVVRSLNSEEIKGTQMGSFVVLGVNRKLVFKLDLHHNKLQLKVMKKLCGLSGVDLITMDMMVKNLTLIGNVDPVEVVLKLRKIVHTQIVSVGPIKEPEKKKEPEIQEPKKEEKKPYQKQQFAELGGSSRAYNPQYNLSTYRAYNPQFNLHSPW